MTANDTTRPTTDDHSPGLEQAARDQAEDLLAAAEYAAGTLRRDRLTTDQTIAILAVMAQVGTGFAQLAAIDAATAQANGQASLAGAVLAEFRAIVASAQPAQEADAS